MYKMLSQKVVTFINYSAGFLQSFMKIKKKKNIKTLIFLIIFSCLVF